MTDAVGPGSLKCVSGSSPGRSLRDIFEHALTGAAAENGVRHLYDSVFLVFTEAEPSELRDRLARQLAEGESVFVVEFERWSSQGPAADHDWLLRRGH